MEKIFENLKPDMKKSLIAMLISMSEADGLYHNNEIALIKSTGLKMGLSLDEIKQVKADLNNFNLHLPDSLNDRMSMFCYLLFIIRVDGMISTREKELMKNIGFRLCLNIDLLNEMFDILEKYNNKKLPDNIIAEKLRKYLN